MRRLCLKSRHFGWLGAICLAPVLVGCANERFETASISRWENIGDVMRMVDTREREAPARLARFREVVDGLDAYHANRLRASTADIRRLNQAQIDRWPARLARTREDIQERMDGNPDFIPDAIARMWY